MTPSPLSQALDQIRRRLLEYRTAAPSHGSTGKLSTYSGTSASSASREAAHVADDAEHLPSSGSDLHMTYLLGSSANRQGS